MALVEVVDLTGAAFLAFDGSGLTWSAKTSKRFSAVPGGSQVINMTLGFDASVGVTFAMSFGSIISFFVTL